MSFDIRINATQCPACDGQRLESVYQVATMPVNSCLLVDNAEEARSFPRGQLDLVVCLDCGFMFNRAFEASAATYNDRYEDSQAYSATFVEYGRQLASSWIGTWSLAGKTLVEIGAGRCDFSRMLLDAGAATVIAMDPTVRQDRVGDDYDGRLVLRAELFDERSSLPPCDAVVFRHVLEHVSQPGALLRSLWDVLIGRGDVPVLVEVPDASRVLTEHAFWDVYYEHCGYFVMDSLRAMFESCGFVVDGISHAFQGQYLVIAAHTAEEPPSAQPARNATATVLQARAFGKHVSADVRRWREKLTSCGEEGLDVVVWGGGSKSTAFLTVVGSTAGEVSRVIDVNPYKHGMFTLGTGHPVVGPEGLAIQPPDLVVVMNPVYLDEITRDICELGMRAEIVALGAGL